MKKVFSEKNRIIIIFAALFVVVAVLLLLIFLQGKQTHTVTFDLDGGTLVKGTLVQTVTKGKDAIAPDVKKTGYSFDAWSESYKGVTEDKVIKAIWSPLPSYMVTFDLDGGTLVEGELEQVVTKGADAVPPKATKEGYYLTGWTNSYEEVSGNIVTKAIWARPATAGVEFLINDSSNYCIVIGGYPYLNGNLFLPSEHDEKSVIGVADRAFENFVNITFVYIPNGVLSVGEEAFANCTSLKEIEIPESLFVLGNGAFKGCTSLEKITIINGLETISADSFAGCTALTEVVLPESVTRIEAGAFAGCTSLETIIVYGTIEVIEDGAFEGCENVVIKTPILEEEMPEDWEDGWDEDVEVEWGIEIETETESESETETETETAKNEKDKK